MLHFYWQVNNFRFLLIKFLIHVHREPAFSCVCSRTRVPAEYYANRSQVYTHENLSLQAQGVGTIGFKLDSSFSSIPISIPILFWRIQLELQAIKKLLQSFLLRCFILFWENISRLLITLILDQTIFFAILRKNRQNRTADKERNICRGPIAEDCKRHEIHQEK